LGKDYIFGTGMLIQEHALLGKIPVTIYTLQTMLGCFNPNLDKIWTNPNVGLKMYFQILTQLQLSLSTPTFFNCIFNPIFGFVHI